MMLDFKAIEAAIGEVVDRYEKTAPPVSEWADDVYRRLRDADTIVLSELVLIRDLKGRDGEEWMQPNYAANRVYKLLNRLGRDTTGSAGF
jgi:hypothetical protein